MCVIMIGDKERPNQNMVERAYNWNDDGAGIAWREGNGDERVVVWKKGLDLDEVSELVKTVPMPFVVHFRITSSGITTPNLCHPFPISETTHLATEGRTQEYVLFHNGDWKDWSETAKYAALTSGVRIPRGRWMDTRAMAWLCSIYGLGFMEFLPQQRGVAFGPKDMEVFNGPGWVKVNDIWCSNDHFMHRSRGNNGTTYYNQPPTATPSHAGPFCEYGTCNNRTNLDVDRRCHVHPKTSFPSNFPSGERGVSNVGQGAIHALPPARIVDPEGNVSGTPEVAQPKTPFRQDAQGPILGLALAERMHKIGRISKNKIKDLRRGHETLSAAILSNNQKKKLKAEKDLTKLTAKIMTSLRGQQA